jgi:hypothetical protein
MTVADHRLAIIPNYSVALNEGKYETTLATSFTAALFLGTPRWNLQTMPTNSDVPDTFTLSGTYEQRVLEALRIAQHQARRAQASAAARMQDALVGLEDALSDQIAWLENAAEDDKADAEESDEAERQRAAWRPLRAA